MSNLSDIKKSIHIVLASDNNYAKQCCVTITSILLNSDKSDFFEFHILDGGIDDKNKDKFRLKDFTNYKVTFYDMQKFDIPQFSILLYHTTVATYYRLFLTEILPKNIDKVIYLDCDLIVIKNIKELWDTDITDYSAAVVQEPNNIVFDYLKPVVNEDFHYFNAGVILFNLETLRKTNFLENCLNFYKQHENKLWYQDQDILNYVLAGKCKFLPILYNIQTSCFYSKNSNNLNKKLFKYYKDNGVIIHFTDKYKPWIFHDYHPMKKEYLKYLAKVNTPIENLLYKLKIFCHIIFIEENRFVKFIKIFNIPVYELNRHKIKIIRLFGIPIYYKFRINNKYREYIFSLRIR